MTDDLMFEILAVWGCMKELAMDCDDMTNASSTYLGIVAGAIIGLIVAWWIYNRQRKTSDKQDEGLRHIKELEESNEKTLESIQHLQNHQEKILNQILDLDKKIDSLVENKDR
jgi:Na+/glutamate symporter